MCECRALLVYRGSADLDVAGGRRGVTTEAEEKVCRKVLHFDGVLWVSVGRNRSSIDLTYARQYFEAVASSKACAPC